LPEPKDPSPAKPPGAWEPVKDIWGANEPEYVKRAANWVRQFRAQGGE
jgi:hypothetical protein